MPRFVLIKQWGLGGSTTMSRLLIIGGTGQIGLGLSVQAATQGLSVTWVGSKPLESRPPIYGKMARSLGATYCAMDVFAGSSQAEFRALAKTHNLVVNTAEPYRAPKNALFWQGLEQFYESLAAAGYTRDNTEGKSFVRVGSPPAEIPSDEHAVQMGISGYVEDRELPPETYSFPEFQTPYFQIKIALRQRALEMAKIHNLQLVNACPTAIIGPFGNHGDLELVLKCLRGEFPFRDYMANFLTDMVSVEGAAQGILLAAQKGKAHETYQLGGEKLHLSHIFEGACRFAGQRPPRFIDLPRNAMASLDAASTVLGLVSSIPLVGGMVRRAIPNPTTLLDPSYVALAQTMLSRSSDKAMDQLGYRPATVEDIDRATQEMVLWYREAGLI